MRIEGRPPEGEYMYLDSCKYIENYQPRHTYTFIGPCIVTGKEVRVTIKAKELYNIRQGMYIQDAAPSLNDDEREFLMTGISAEGWKEAFGDEEGDEDADND